MNFGSIGRGILSGVKNLGKNVANSALVSANALERAFGGSGLLSANIADKFGTISNPAPGTPSKISAAPGTAQVLLQALTGLAPEANSDTLRSTRQISAPSSASVPPQALGLAPSVQRVGNAAVPAPPAAPGAPGPSFTPPPPAPVPNTPASLDRIGGGLGPSPSSSFGAAVPQAAVLRGLTAPGRPGGYVATPEGLPVGSAPRRRLRPEPSF